eukprot:CAMPEP_0117523456 /NCGR_PEP_ID=MMETSP0784-20121206/34737_1 /TAXON_ID=39447 /ORGANISM="" /LENGTH=347 /DNA_ID=CAMNT_0005319569 /DNA_START=8 /DNA_END=1051 /DNA_ORIENTATION=-
MNRNDSTLSGGPSGFKTPIGPPGLALEDASYEELSTALSSRLQFDRDQMARQLEQLTQAEEELEERRQQLEKLEQRIFSVNGEDEDVIELNVGGQSMSTTRGVLCSAKDSLLAGMFSGNFDNSIKKDKEGKFFLDVDPGLFAKVLTHLRLRRIASPDLPAPLPIVPEELRAEFDMVVKYYGLDTFMYGDGLSGNIFQRIAELSGVPQTRLATNKLVNISLSSTGGVPVANHEEVLSQEGLHERSLENSYGAHPNSIIIRFRKHRVCVEAMELRAKTSDATAHMSNQWVFRHGSTAVCMQYAFSRAEPWTGRMEVKAGMSFTDCVEWSFPNDFCLEHIVLYGRVMQNV